MSVFITPKEWPLYVDTVNAMCNGLIFFLHFFFLMRRLQLPVKVASVISCHAMDPKKFNRWLIFVTRRANRKHYF